MSSREKDQLQLLDEVVRLLALLVREAAAGNQSESISLLSKAGFGPSRIAELLGTTPGTVKVSVSRSKKSRKTSS